MQSKRDDTGVDTPVGTIQKNGNDAAPNKLRRTQPCAWRKKAILGPCLFPPRFKNA